MSSRRVLKVAEAIREVVGMAILVDLRDPRIRDVTVTRVEVSKDLRIAKVYVSVMGDEARQQLSLHGLEHAAGFLQQKVAARVDTRYTPRIRFVLDQGVKKSLEVARILDELKAESPVDGAADDDQQPADDASSPQDSPPDADSANTYSGDDDRPSANNESG